VRQQDIRSRGSAIECRVYAEDPETGFAPSPGKVLHLVEPHGPGVRVDSGIVAGQEVPTHYDPILSKVIAWAPDREQAVRRMGQALDAYVVLGVRTNLSYLRAVVDQPAFVAGDLSTDFLSMHLRDWRRPGPTPEVAAVAALLSGRDQAGQPAGVDHSAETAFADPWDSLRGWRIG
jgi:acetyl/propionyl-CoA carboxylase alpha subunit